MLFDDATGNGQLQAQTAALFVQTRGGRGVRWLYSGFFSDDDHSRVGRLGDAAFDGDRTGLRLFSQYGPETGRQRGSQASEISTHRRGSGTASDFETYASVLSLMHTFGHFGHQLKEIEPLIMDGNAASVELGDFAKLRDQLGHPCA